MKTLRTTSLALALGLACAHLAAQTTPVPTQFSDWTGAVDNNFFNAANWSTGSVPDSPVAAIRLPGDTAIANKDIVATHTGDEDRTIQFYSIQTGANKSYTIEFSSEGDGVLYINPVGKGFTFNGLIGSTPELGRSLDLTYPESTGDDSTRLAAYYKLGRNTVITAADSYAGSRVANSGLGTGIFTLTDNARIDISMAGEIPFVYEGYVENRPGVVTYTSARTDGVRIGGILEAGPNTTIYVGGRNVTLNDKLTTGQVSIMGGLFYQEPANSNSANAICDVYGYITRMTGQVNYEGDGRARFRIRSGAQYLVEGVHNGGIQAMAGSVIGGSGIINGFITVDEGGMLTPGYLGSTIGNSPDTPLTINATNFELNGSLGFDLVTETVHDRLDVTLTGTMTIRSSTTVDSTSSNPRYANLIINMADTFPRIVRTPVTYELMTVNLDVASSGTDVMILGDFENTTLPASMTLKTTWEWKSESEYNYTYLQDMEVRRTLLVTVEQTPFSGVPQLASGDLGDKYLAAARKVDDIYYNTPVASQAAYEPLFESLNRQPSIIQYCQVLDQLTPSVYQSWFPAAVVRTNSLVQSVEDRMYQDAAFKRQKGSWQAFLDGFRQEASKGNEGDADYSNYGIVGTVVGTSYAISENFVVGGFFSYEFTDFDLDTAGGYTDLNSYTFGLSARYNTGKLQFNFTGFYGVDDYESERSVALTGLGTWAKSDTDGSRLGAAISAAYTVNLPWFEVVPVAGLQVMNWKVDGFEERNAGAASLRVYDQEKMSLQGKLGVRVARSFPLKHGVLRPYLHYSYLHEFDDDERWIASDLFGERMSVRGPDIGSNGWRMDIGLDWNVTRKLRAELRYQSEYRGAAKESVGVRGGITYTF
ncbi:uncharacterized protein YhjY with autotransporter beta-barrel domain [Ereboglobus sp. PH5-10]|uniref:autotransporter outer membrane beta-barrel domain-containing protein n=1 Tax=Ereboglobus sp. PH5-10 TaxID=2940629 RepID=UPI0024069524|nr:autotransporter outer membrane beta-barrel domain-containing protein [Ereboglobus sp. PH5-10]MDF9827606.1 uncharacterized protein YhjY with autotransporter beta-barrel domain [Ereboglobus sp. PH5-10]